MKAGQVLSTIEFPGLDPDQSEYLQQRLASLRDDVPPVSWKQIHGVLEGEWGSAPEEVLAEIDPEPAAAASIGQVHRGRYPRRRRGRGQGPVPGDRRGGRVRHAQPANALPGPAPADAGPRGQGHPRRARRADHRRVRLRARGRRPPPPRPLLARPPLHSRPGRRHLAQPPPRPRHRVGRRHRRSSRSPTQPDPVRDRYAEIVYRFFYANAGELDLALGDPHPGNYLLCEDGRVAFFDFGMIRELPRGYLAPRGGGVRGAPRVRRRRAGRGYARARLPARARRPSGTGRCCSSRCARRAGGFSRSEPRRLAPEDLWRGTEALRETAAPRPSS